MKFEYTSDGGSSMHSIPMIIINKKSEVPDKISKHKHHNFLYS